MRCSVTKELRRPPDVANLVSCLFGIPSGVSRSLLSSNAQAVVHRGAVRRFSHKGIVRIVEKPSRSTMEPMEPIEMDLSDAK